MTLPEPFELPDGSPRPIPGVTPALVADLERRFPDRAPSPGEDLARVWFNAGAASVVRALRSSLELEEHGPDDVPVPAAMRRGPTPFERSRRVRR